MKIAIITGPFVSIPPGPCGAIERVWWGLAREFVNAGHEVTFYARPPGVMPDLPSGLELKILRGKSRSGKIYRDLVSDLFYSLSACWKLEQADIVIPHSFWLPILLPRLRRRHGKVVAQISRFPKRQIDWYLRSEALSVPSSAVGDAVLEQCPAAKSLIRLIPFSIEADLFVPPDPSRVVNPGSGTLLYTGRIVPEKGLHLLVAAWARLRAEMPDLKLSLMGPVRVEEGGGGETYRQQLLEAAQGHAFELCPPVYDAAELARTLQQADYYCYPYHIAAKQ